MIRNTWLNILVPSDHIVYHVIPSSKSPVILLVLFLTILDNHPVLQFACLVWNRKWKLEKKNWNSSEMFFARLPKHLDNLRNLLRFFKTWSKVAVRTSQKLASYETFVEVSLRLKKNISVRMSPKLAKDLNNCGFEDKIPISIQMNHPIAPKKSSKKLLYV